LWSAECGIRAPPCTWTFLSSLRSGCLHSPPWQATEAPAGADNEAQRRTGPPIRHSAIRVPQWRGAPPRVSRAPHMRLTFQDCRRVDRAGPPSHPAPVGGPGFRWIWIPATSRVRVGSLGSPGTPRRRRLGLFIYVSRNCNIFVIIGCYRSRAHRAFPPEAPS